MTPLEARPQTPILDFSYKDLPAPMAATRIMNTFLANVNVHVRYLLSPVRLCLSSVCLSSVTFVRPTQAVQIFGNISTALGTLAIR